MASIDSCNAEIRMYKALLTKLDAVAQCLNNASGWLEPLSGIISDSYNVNDGGTPITNKCSSLSGDMSKEAKYINNTLIPAVKSAIRRNQNDIRTIQSKG